VSIAQWDRVDGRRREAGHISGSWFDLGRVAGSVAVGLRRVVVDPERWATPAHVHGADEEIFYVLGGSGLSWQDGACYEIGAEDCLVHHAGNEAHTVRAGSQGIDLLAFGTRTAIATAHWPRTGISLLGASWVRVGEGENWDAREAAAGEPEIAAPSERPERIVKLADVQAEPWGQGRVEIARRDLGRAAGSIATGLRHVRVEPGKWGAVPHCHSAEEELFVVLAGDGTLLLGDDEQPIQAGHVISRPAGTGVAHAMRAGEHGLVYLAYGTREPNDISYYPRSNNIYIRGIGLTGRIEQLDYWDGETYT
jgi:uncharacterized cupin superfamily protein